MWFRNMQYIQLIHINPSYLFIPKQTETVDTLDLMEPFLKFKKQWLNHLEFPPNGILFFKFFKIEISLF